VGATRPSPTSAGPTGPPVRTFKPRRRPLTAARAALFEQLAPHWCLDECGRTLDPVEEFGRSAPMVLDVGIGLGEQLTAMAAVQPDIDVIGVDVHTPGIASTLARIEAASLTNVRLVHGDALEFIRRLAPGSLHGIRIYFPDPWPKARHRHRRLTNADRVDRFVALLAPQGVLHVATDVDDYATQTARVCAAHPELTGGVVARPDWRPHTRYERKALLAGRPVTDLVYVRTPATTAPDRAARTGPPTDRRSPLTWAANQPVRPPSGSDTDPEPSLAAPTPR
jgi:tRNA (guanine-N7-)-methyltransferase